MKTASKIICRTVGDLPDPSLIGRDLFCDFETSSGQDRVDGLDPWHEARVCGIALAGAEGPAFYAPVRHRGIDKDANLPIENVDRWMTEIFQKTDRWFNHNVKFDATFAWIAGWMGSDPYAIPELICSVAKAKLVDSDRWSHELKPLARDWLGESTETQDEVQAYLDGIVLPHRAKCVDYARVPVDILGPYACDDVLLNRRLFAHLEERMPSCSRQVERTEEQLTSVLWDMEREGLRVDVQRTKLELRSTLMRQLAIDDRVTELTGVELQKSAKCYGEIMIGMLGLPVLVWNYSKKTGERTGPSFDKKALKLYEEHPLVLADERAMEIVPLLAEYSKLETYRTLFLEPFLEKNVDGRLHSWYNQNVRTGRMSCQRPNTQQFDDRASLLILPDDDMWFVDADGSQIEFRIIVHYSKDEDAMAAYERDPRTDFHDWVTELCNLPPEARSAGKTMNFSIAFGAGKKRTTAQLVSNRYISALIDTDDPHVLLRECKRRAEDIYETYHAKFSGVKRASRKASGKCRRNGYVQNAFGRRRHLPSKVAHKAFNSAVQSTAGDMVKERMVATSPRFNERIRGLGMRTAINKHDQITWQSPADAAQNVEVETWLNGMLEEVRPLKPLRTPIVWDIGKSPKNWKEAKA